MIRPTVTWYVVADGAIGRIFANEGPGKGLFRAVAKDFTVGESLHTSDMVSDREGRSADPAGSGRHAMNAATDPHAHQEAEFLRRLATTVGEAGRKGRYDRLVIVAEPRALGALRTHLPRAARDRVVGELDKDLTKLPDTALASHLETAGLLM